MNSGRHGIVMNIDSLYWPDDIVQFIVCHEIGHYMNGQRKPSLLRFLKCMAEAAILGYEKHEVATDKFAVNMTGIIKDRYLELIKLFKEPFIYHPQIDESEREVIIKRFF